MRERLGLVEFEKPMHGLPKEILGCFSRELLSVLGGKVDVEVISRDRFRRIISSPNWVLYVYDQSK